MVKLHTFRVQSNLLRRFCMRPINQEVFCYVLTLLPWPFKPLCPSVQEGFGNVTHNRDSYNILFDFHRRIDWSRKQWFGLVEAVGAVRGWCAISTHTARAVTRRYAAGPAAQPLCQGNRVYNPKTAEGEFIPSDSSYTLRAQCELWKDCKWTRDQIVKCDTRPPQPSTVTDPEIMFLYSVYTRIITIYFFTFQVYLVPDPTKETKRKTRVLKRNSHPSFMEMLEYRLPIEVVKNRSLQATVWHYDSLQENQFLGGVVIPLNSLPLREETVAWYPLEYIPR